MKREEVTKHLNILLANRCWDCRYECAGNKVCDKKCVFKQAVNEAIEALQDKEAETKCIAQINVDMDEIVERIKEEYDIERPKVKWIEERVKSVGDVWEKTWYRCSKCKRHEYRKTNFCPNCGADMRGER